MRRQASIVDVGAWVGGLGREDGLGIEGPVADAVLADRKLGGVCKDCVTTEFAPGEIKFKDAAGKDRLLYGGDIFFEATVWFKP